MEIFEDYYLVVDLEATCSEDKLITRGQQETIEIGAVLLNGVSLEIEGEFQSFVRPHLHPQLTEFCTSLTSITQTDVDAAPPFPAAFEKFQQWLAPFGSYCFCAWGDFDLKQIRRDCRRHELEAISPAHLNIKTAFRAFMKTQGLRGKFNLSDALRYVGLSFSGQLHRGIDDARNTASLIRAVRLSTKKADSVEDSNFADQG